MPAPPPRTRPSPTVDGATLREQLLPRFGAVAINGLNTRLPGDILELNSRFPLLRQETQEEPFGVVDGSEDRNPVWNVLSLKYLGGMEVELSEGSWIPGREQDVN